MEYKLLIYQRSPVENLREFLNQNGFIVDFADEDNILRKVRERDYDACIVDAFGMERYTLVEEVRKASRRVAVIFLTESNNGFPHDALNAFDYGADDYINMPYDIEELVRRLQAILRRAGKTAYGTSHKIGRYLFNPMDCTLTLEGEVEKLTAKEARLIMLMYEYREQTTPMKFMLEALWGEADMFRSRALNVSMVGIRKKFKGDEKVSITNVKGQGYILSWEG